MLLLVYGNFEKHHIEVETVIATLRVTFGDIWATFHSIIWSHCLLYFVWLRNLNEACIKNEAV